MRVAMGVNFCEKIFLRVTYLMGDKYFGDNSLF